VSVTSSSARLSISVPMNGGASAIATGSSTSFTLTKEC
jgi:hypothetical protein